MDNKIVLRQSSIIINNYLRGDCPRLEEFFTQYDKVTHSFYTQGMEFDTLNSKLILPRGLDVTYLERLFDTKAVYDRKFDMFDVNKNIKLKYLPRDEVQKAALRFVLGEAEYSNTRDASQYCINLDTGAGKTYVAIAAVAITAIKPIIIASNVDWINQWMQRAQEYSNLTPKDMYFFQGSASITKILKGVIDPSQYTLFLATHGTIKSYGDTFGWEKISELFQKIKVGIKIFDEAHLNFDNMCKIDFHTNTFKTFYLTATPARSDKDENLLYQLYFKNVFMIDLFNQETDPRTNYVGIHYKSKPTPMEVNSCYTYHGFNSKAYANYIVKKPNYYKMLRIIMDFIDKHRCKTLIYIATNNAIYETREWLIREYPEYANEIGVYSSLVDKKDKPAQLNKGIILTTTNSAGACSDIPDLKLIVMLAEPFKSAVLAKQTLGRARDRNTLYMEIVDDSFNEIRRYYRYKHVVFSKYALSCKDVNLIYELDERAEKIEQMRTAMFMNAKPTVEVMPTVEEEKPLRKFYTKIM